MDKEIDDTSKVMTPEEQEEFTEHVKSIMAAPPSEDIQKVIDRLQEVIENQSFVDLLLETIENHDVE